jgi:hypothetical protein
MIFVIVPLGKAASDVVNWLIRVLVYVAASTLGGALVGVLTGLLGTLLYTLVPGPTLAWPVVVLAVFALLYALHEAYVLRLPQPERHWQVPNAWVRRWPIFGTALFGLLLGTGLFTFIPFTSFYVLLAWEAGTGSLLLATALGATYGLVRGLPAILGGLFILRGGHPLDFNMWLMNSVPAIHRLSGALLGAVAGFLLVLAARM